MVSVVTMAKNNNKWKRALDNHSRASTQRTKRNGETVSGNAHDDNPPTPRGGTRVKNGVQNKTNGGKRSKKRKASHTPVQMEAGNKRQCTHNKHSLGNKNAPNESGRQSCSVGTAMKKKLFQYITSSSEMRAVSAKLSNALSSKRKNIHLSKEDPHETVGRKKCSLNFESTKSASAVHQPRDSNTKQPRDTVSFQSTAAPPQMCDHKGCQSERDRPTEPEINTELQTIVVKKGYPSPLQHPQCFISESSEQDKNIIDTLTEAIVTSPKENNIVKSKQDREEVGESEIVVSSKRVVKKQANSLSGTRIDFVTKPIYASVTENQIKTKPTNDENRLPEKSHTPLSPVKQTSRNPDAFSILNNQSNSSPQEAENNVVEMVLNCKIKYRTTESENLDVKKSNTEKTGVSKKNTAVTLVKQVIGNNEVCIPSCQREVSKIETQHNSSPQTASVHVKDNPFAAKIENRACVYGSQVPKEINAFKDHLEKTQKDALGIEECGKILSPSMDDINGQRKNSITSNQSEVGEEKCQDNLLPKTGSERPQCENNQHLKNIRLYDELITTPVNSNQHCHKSSIKSDNNIILSNVEENDKHTVVPEKNALISENSNTVAVSTLAIQATGTSMVTVIPSNEKGVLSKMQKQFRPSPQAATNDVAKPVNLGDSQPTVKVEGQGPKDKYDKVEDLEIKSQADVLSMGGYRKMLPSTKSESRTANNVIEKDSCAQLSPIKRKSAKVRTKRSLKNKSQALSTSEREVDISEGIEIPCEMKASNLMSRQSYILHCISKYTCTANISSLDVFLLDKKSYPTSSFHVTTVILNVILDSMGFICAEKCNAGTSSAQIVCPLPKERKQTQTPQSVRNFIMELFEVNNIEHDGVCTIEQICLAFRLACHFALLVCDPSQGIHKKKSSKQKKSNQNKLSEQLKRGLLTLLSCLRGLLVLLLEKDNHRIEIFFNGNGLHSSAELLLLDIVPLLTDMDSKHGVLGPKKSIAIFKQLVKFEKSLKSFYERRGLSLSHSSRKSSYDGLMEMFMRQLLSRENVEGGDVQLKKELYHCQSKLSSSGILACTLSSVTPSCQDVLTQTIALRQNTINMMAELLTPKPRDDKAFVKVTPGTASNTSDRIERYDGEDSIWYDAHLNVKKKYNELRIDGCIYLSKILDFLRKGGQTCNSSQKEKSVEAPLLQLHRTVFFLFHRLFNIDPFPEPSNAKSLHQRNNLKSAGKSLIMFHYFLIFRWKLFTDLAIVLACLLLAGKIIDRPVKLRRLLDLSSRIAFPNLNILDKIIIPTTVESQDERKMFDIKSGDDAKKALIKDYEFHLLMSFGFVAPTFEDICQDGPLTKIESNLDARSLACYKNTYYHIGFSHSPLCLLEDTEFVALGVYHLSCEITGMSLCVNYTKDFLEEERRIAKYLFLYMNKTALYVKERVKQIQQLQTTINTTGFPSIVNTVDVDLPDFQSLLEGINYVGAEIPSLDTTQLNT